MRVIGPDLLTTLPVFKKELGSLSPEIKQISDAIYGIIDSRYD
jgi:hypothetical protein